MLFRAPMCRQPSRLFTMARRVTPVRKAAADNHASQASSFDNSQAYHNTSQASSATPNDAAEGQGTFASGPSTTPVSSGISFHDSPVYESRNSGTIDWSDSFHGLGQAPFPKEVNDILLAPLEPSDIEIKPDGILYLPEIKYRRILNRAFGPGGWGLAPRTSSHITPKQVSREYALICSGRLVSVARGEQDYYGGEEKLTTALEGCKSNALMRCCKDLGIASELWDPAFIRKFKKEYCDDAFVEHVLTKKKKKLWKLKANEFDYPYKKC
ncbi:hypothetical protein JCM33374_g313 [Metschnikowia sp. JCM 33374]|nr:hypothetical protein JCM33374_g313 [Metschnikowia sp. JCM 33374]